MHKRYLPVSPDIPTDTTDAHAMAALELAEAEPEERAAYREALKAAGATRRGVPDDYRGDDPSLCNAPTKSGRPCRALGIGSNGRCKAHGGVEACARKSRARRKLEVDTERALLRAKVRKSATEWASRHSSAG